jgi:hypothetical protein
MTEGLVFFAIETMTSRFHRKSGSFGLPMPGENGKGGWPECLGIPLRNDDLPAVISFSHNLLPGRTKKIGRKDPINDGP